MTTLTLAAIYDGVASRFGETVQLTILPAAEREYVLPAGVTLIEEDAFAGTNAVLWLDSENVTVMGDTGALLYIVGPHRYAWQPD